MFLEITRKYKHEFNDAENVQVIKMTFRRVLLQIFMINIPATTNAHNKQTGKQKFIKKKTFLRV